MREIGTIAFQGQEFQALGATTSGEHITAYTKTKRNCYPEHITLTNWHGKTILDCRFRVVDKYSNGGLAIAWHLANGKFIVGYALGDNGMLFRGEVTEILCQRDAHRRAVEIADYFLELDTEEDDEILIGHTCPECQHEWHEIYQTATLSAQTVISKTSNPPPGQTSKTHHYVK